MASTSRQMRLAKSLPPQLTRFFARYPPSATLQPSQHSPIAPESPLTASIASSPDPTALMAKSILRNAENLRKQPSPFKATKHPVTNKWHDPVFSLRRQADLVKLAREHGVEELLPHSVKGTVERLRRREENGLQVKGTGIGQKVKGKAWERSMKTRLEKRRQAMLDMPKMIQTWKERGHGRGWKKWPK